MRLLATNFRRTGLALGLLLGALGGCFNPTSLLNPDFLSTIGLGSKVAIVPGENPAIVIEVENQTTHVVDTRLTVRDGAGNVSERQYTLGAGQKRSETWVCPVEAVTLGDVSDLTSTGAIVRLGNGDPADPFIVVEPFGVLLRNEINYACGQKVNFSVVTSGATQSGYQVFAYVSGG